MDFLEWYELTINYFIKLMLLKLRVDIYMKRQGAQVIGEATVLIQIKFYML